MDPRQFNDPASTYVIMVFVGENKLNEMRAQLEAVDRMNHVLMTVQPCPEEAITFLHHISADLPGRLKGMEPEYYWEGFRLKSGTPEKVIQKIQRLHHTHLIAILDQEIEKVRKTKIGLLSLQEHFAD